MARATMGLEKGTPIHPKHNSPFHNHQPNASKAGKLVMMAKLKERAQEEANLSLANILNEEAVRDPETMHSLSAVDARRAMKRARGTAEPAIPRTLEELREELSQVGREGLRLTTGNTEFFLNEPIRGADGETLAEGFVSHRILQHLRRHPAEASHILMDATFKTVPRRPQGVQQFF
ncbi:uncharacterized protein LOC111044506 isoform X1 [Nilaparvata lugens]|uniref:uncharacterized protein LOC111044506 isoform X1 n=1 Tax=Nilaparvata lugens TaxID=108931 RepID=UPI00193E0C84|nr:uncharacterized protein LOC111044506 isoform X1 [Nilaparvata lugens]XP_039277017.1 uncharacterized protein LOC111044506 isoform X1 [Nilaparvata lugens]